MQEIKEKIIPINFYKHNLKFRIVNLNDTDLFQCHFINSENHDFVVRQANVYRKFKAPKKLKLSFLTTLIVIFSISLLNAQITKEVDDGIFVTFPVSPNYKTTTAASTYVGKTENCLFMVIIQRNAIPKYAEYLKAKQEWTNAEVEKVENSFLDNAVKGKLNYSENKGTIDAIKIGKYNGRKIDYSAINPTTGEREKKV